MQTGEAVLVVSSYPSSMIAPPLPEEDLNEGRSVTQGGRHLIQMSTERKLFFIPPSRRQAHASPEIRFHR